MGLAHVEQTHSGTIGLPRQRHEPSRAEARLGFSSADLGAADWVWRMSVLGTYSHSYRARRDYDSDRRQHHAQLRSARLAAAREKGTHEKIEWETLLEVFGKCVACGVPYSHLHGGRPTQDHIFPICGGGCDCIGNLQPLCRNCNSSLGPNSTDFRNAALPGWFGRYRLRLSERLHGR